AASMPRLAIGEADARAIAEHFIPTDEPERPVTLGDGERGRGIFQRFGCSSCHHFTGSGLPEPTRLPVPEVRLAPDLRHTRARMRAATLLAWFTAPTALKPDTLMPYFALSDEERRDLAAFILEAPLEPAKPAAPPLRLPVLERRVAYKEVETRVFKRVCWHCHSDPVPVGGDGGPGNTGGLGFAGRGVDFSSFAHLKRAVLEPDSSGVPLVVAVMLARHVEAAGGEVPGRRGMPLGLAPMSLEEIQLVESWIAQGAHGP
ncbi:MAG: cytochrome c family protein, partial [Planctomycetota bacterium]